LILALPIINSRQQSLDQFHWDGQIIRHTCASLLDVERTAANLMAAGSLVCGVPSNSAMSAFNRSRRDKRAIPPSASSKSEQLTVNATPRRWRSSGHQPAGRHERPSSSDYPLHGRALSVSDVVWWHRSDISLFVFNLEHDFLRCFLQHHE
jgi:hypothetical protein